MITPQIKKWLSPTLKLGIK